MSASGAFTIYNNYINNCEPATPEYNVVIYDAMQQCVDMGDACGAVTFNTGICNGANPNVNCWDNAIPDPSQKAQEVYFCKTGKLQWGGAINQNFVSAIKQTFMDVFNSDLPPDPGPSNDFDDKPKHRNHHHH
mmetsp:Transcript_13483/g.45663  ORF Transcript_13483/g.45663 Transcript_13483/m.45663 type:complete len:133 (+) Transcript_13483:96-494(+)